ncbi:zinc finger protein 583-like [Notolabrus celidotus]|uniref:zinc finger protein 583-like n=1 Tax=Notolabrus celidotus TaxID=1203425 RepID=UPI0014907065|nr:zinc finger protein 583-like [Notolabrus celidotus]
MSFSSSFGTQVAAIMDVLANAAVAEITKLVEDGTVVLRLEMCRRDSEIQELKRSLELMEGELCKAREEAKTRAPEEEQKQTEAGSQAPCKDERGDQETFAEYVEPKAADSLCEPQHAAEESHDTRAVVKQEPAVLELATQVQTDNMATTDICFEQDDLIWPPPVCSLFDDNSDAMQEQTHMFPPLSEQYDKTYAEEITVDSLNVQIKDEVESRLVCMGNNTSELVQKEQFKQTSHPLHQEQCSQPASQQAGPSLLSLNAQRQTANRLGAHTEDHILSRKNQRMKRIMSLSRANQKLFTCSVCNKGFIRMSQLEEHRATHQPLKPYRCLECGKSFTQKRRLQTHQSVHTGERPFSCKICGKMFSRPDNCRRHERFHSGLKPYGCGQCGKNFTVLGNLRMHQEIHRKGR